MSTEPQNQIPQAPQYQPQQWPGYTTNTTMPVMPPQAPKKAKKKWLVPVLIAAALLLGVGMGNASAAAKPAEVKVQTKEVEKVVEKKVPVPTTPAACVEALNQAEDIISSAGRAVGIMSDMFKAAARLDAATVTRLSPQIDEETALLNVIRPKYQSAAATCRASK